MEMVCIYLESMLNMRVERKLAATLHQDTSQLVMYSLMERLLRNIIKKLTIGPFVLAFHKLKFLWPSGNATLKQFTLKNKIFIKESYMWGGITAKPFSGFLHTHSLGYPLSQHMKFQKLPVSFVWWFKGLILLMMETGSFQNVLCVVIIEKFLMK
jgi:hypothetical protein